MNETPDQQPETPRSRRKPTELEICAKVLTLVNDLPPARRLRVLNYVRELATDVEMGADDPVYVPHV